MLSICHHPHPGRWEAVSYPVRFFRPSGL